jgi:2-iminobutanoate/2-iminopropanoate deaminase
MAHQKRVISTDKSPKAIGPYSQAIHAGCFIFCSGQVGFNPATGFLVEGGVTAETRQALLNIKAILEAAGSDFAHVVKTTIFLQNINDFSTVNAIYGEFFSTEPPARSTVQVAALPRNAAVEIECVALVID